MIDFLKHHHEDGTASHWDMAFSSAPSLIHAMVLLMSFMTESFFAVGRLFTYTMMSWLTFHVETSPNIVKTWHRKMH